mmetsp:Transcript_23872/g.42484  ORF Transcript_23872/g.42484 Transcript_23872/m.42484 type:complete len:100 (+) Transcript_23872:327-626(+)
MADTQNAHHGQPAKKRRVALTVERTTVGVLGGGAWGTALAIHCARMGHTTRLWCLEPEVESGINKEHENTVYLAGVKVGCGADGILRSGTHALRSKYTV